MSLKRVFYPSTARAFIRLSFADAFYSRLLFIGGVMIQLKTVSKAYTFGGRAFHALNGLDLTVEPGKIFGVLGRSGAGKSTLLRAINLLERPTRGEVIVHGVNLTALSPAALRQYRHKIGMVFQHFNLLESRNVFHNVALPLEIQHYPRQAIEKRVTEVLGLVGLADKHDFLPSQLSGGQKQRVGIARALASHPDVLLCDEPTSALDTESTRSILNLLKRINREFNLTIVLITHELDVVKQICDRVGVLHEGQLVEEASTVNIFSAPQHPVTQQLVQQALHFYSPTLRESGSLILKLTFVGESSEAPLISYLIKNFDVTINIKQALIENIQETTVGFTICELVGEQQSIERALHYIRSTSIQVEILHAYA